MKVLKKILSWLANPKWYFLLPVMLIAVIATVAATLIMTQDGLSEYMILGYVALGIMIVTLSYSIFGVIRIYPKAKERILKWAEKRPRINGAFNEYGFTALVTTAGSLIITLAFAVYNGSVAIVIRSIWFGALAAYYIAIIVLRGSILIYHGRRTRALRKGQSETQTLINDGRLYRACGVMLFMLPLCLSFAIMQMVAAGDSFEHRGVTIYVYAVYAFYKIITAIYSFVKEHRNNSMTILSIRCVKLADALVSILALQTAMFREFNGDFSDMLVTRMNAITGAAVCLLTIAVGVYMIVSASVRIKKLKRESVSIQGREQGCDGEGDTEIDREGEQ